MSYGSFPDSSGLAGFGHLIGSLINRNKQETANQDYYNAALQGMGQTPQNIQGINNFSPSQIQELINENQANQTQTGKRNSLGIINPAYKNLPSNVDPGYLYDYTAATQTPIASAKAKQQAEQETQGPLFDAQKQTYLQNPEAVYGADHPVTQFAKQYPDQWGSFVNAAKTQDQLESMVKPFTGNREASQKLSKEQTAQSYQQSQISHEQAQTKEVNAILPYKLSEYEKELNSSDPEVKNDYTQYQDMIKQAVHDNTITPQQAHTALLTKLGVLNKGEELKKQLVQIQSASKAHNENLSTLQRLMGNKLLTPQQRQQYTNEFNSESGIAGPQPTLRFQWK